MELLQIDLPQCMISASALPPVNPKNFLRLIEAIHLVAAVFSGSKPFFRSIFGRCGPIDSRRALSYC